MQKSKIDICNVSLSLLGLESIRSFDEDNIRSRLCNVTFDVVRDYYLSKYDWTFARRYAKLNAIAIEKDYPPGMYPYSIPSDCIMPRNIIRRGTRMPWALYERELICPIAHDMDTDVGLFYTARAYDTFSFSEGFVNAVSYEIASPICLPLTGDKEMRSSIAEASRIVFMEDTESDANVGSENKNPDDDPNYDSFVRTEPSWVQER